MKKILFVLALFGSVNLVAQKYKYCELVGVEKFLSTNLMIAVDSGQLSKSFWKEWSVIKEEKPETRNEKVYVKTDLAMYEGKQVQTDDKGKYIWKAVTTEPEKKVRPKTFSSMIEGMNYMADMGWELDQVYAAKLGDQNVYRWVLRKNK